MAKKKARKPAKRPVKKKVVKSKAKPKIKAAARTAQKKDVCCVRMNSREWDLKQHVWKREPFFVVKHGLFFHIPINFGGIVKTAMDQLEKTYKPEYPFMMLERELNWFTGKLMVALKKPAKGPDVEYLSGTFISKVFNGPYNRLGPAVQELAEHVRKKRGARPTEFYFWYTVCPRCAKKLGGYQTIIFARMV